MKIQPKIISTVIITTLFITFLFQYNYIRLQKNELLFNLSTKIEKTNTLLSQINSGPLFYYDIKLIKTNIESFLKDPEIKSINISESSGDINLFYENKNVTNKDLIEIETDIFYEDSKIGKVVTAYSKDKINKRLITSIKNIVYTFIASSIIVTIFLLIFVKRIMSPIKELTDLSYEISNGNLNKEITLHSSDEIGTLSKSLMKMRNSIKEKIEYLNIENDERKKAEIKLRLKTEELARANKELTEHRTNLEELVNKRTFELKDSISKLEETKDQLVQSEKMASLGDLVAGVAHEINTPIGIGVTAASHLEYETKKFFELYQSEKMSKSVFEKYLELVSESSTMILTNMIRAANLIQSFKKVAVDQSSEEKRSFKINEYIKEIFLSINSKFKHTNYKVNIENDEDFTLNSYPGAISQIITNLSINSLIHGFEDTDSGTITIKITKMDSMAQIIYSDTGKGIDKNTIKRIYDPFFTTKRGQGGSGLGMNIVYNLVNQTLKGKIKCLSNPGEGTTFIIEIPINI